MTTKMKIKKGDEVQVLTGKDKGKVGEVIKVLRDTAQVIVQGVNVAKRHQKPTQFDTGGMKEKELPLHVSNVGVLDPKDRKPARLGYKILNDGRKVRFARRSGEVLES